MPSATASPRVRSGYLPSLDGWRAVAIFGVIMTHDSPIYVHGYSLCPYQGFGGWGVFLFFAISGILICGRILDDEHLTGQFKVSSFYTRRLFRIQPAMFCYLAALGVLTLLGVCRVSRTAWFAALFLYTNFLPHSSNPSPDQTLVAHFWTLAVEEHFYILLSLLLLFFRKRRILVFTVVLAGLLSLQTIARTRGFYSDDDSQRRTYWNLQYLLFPALWALLLRAPHIKPFVQRYLHPWVAFLITADWIVITIGLHKPGPDLINILDSHIDPLLWSLPLWVIATMLHPRSFTTRLLEWRPLRYFGRLSYSVYLWHVLFFAARNPALHVQSRLLLLLSQRPWRYVASLLAAMASYYLVEKPMIRLGHRLAPPATPGHRDLDPAQPPHTVTSAVETAGMLPG